MPLPKIPTKTPKQTAIQTIINECLAHVDSYETRAQPNLDIADWAQQEKHYHNRRHTDFVSQEILQLLQAEQKTPDSPLAEKKEENADLCRLFAGTHDYDQQENSSASGYYGGNEKRSLKWLVEKMKASGQFTDEDIEIAKIALIGTWTPVVDGQLRQVAGEFETGEGPQATFQKKITDLASTYGITINLEIFKNPRAIAIAKLLADADLATLGNQWSIYWKNMMLFFREQNPEINSDTPDNSAAWKGYLRFQVTLLKNHTYHSQAARDRYLHCRTNAAEVKTILGNTTVFEASFQAMLDKKDDYHRDGAMDVLGS